MTAGLAIQATTNLHHLPIGPWAGLAVLAAWAAAGLLAGGLAAADCATPEPAARPDGRLAQAVVRWATGMPVAQGMTRPNWTSSP